MASTRQAQLKDAAADAEAKLSDAEFQKLNDQKLAKQASDHDEEYASSMDKIESFNKTLHRFTPSPIAINTISTLANINAVNMPLEPIKQRHMKKAPMRVVRKAAKQNFVVKIQDPDSDSDSDSGDEGRHGNKKGFSNCVILKFQGVKTVVAVKIFSNGTLHVTGPTSLTETLDACHFVCRFLDAIFKFEPGSFAVASFFIQMYNCNFTTETPLLRSSVHKFLRSQGFVAMNEEKQPGVVVKMPVDGRVNTKTEEVTCMIFKTGEIVITGAKRGREILDVYCNILKHLDEGYDAIIDRAAVLKKKEKTKSKSTKSTPLPPPADSDSEADSEDSDSEAVDSDADAEDKGRDNKRKNVEDEDENEDEDEDEKPPPKKQPKRA